MSAPILSIVSAVYDKARHLPVLLDNLRGQADFGGEVEFVFADDASTDGSADLLEAEARTDPRIRLLRNAENRGPAIRLNQAAAAARGRWLLPVDADDRLSANAVAVFLKVAQEREVDLVFARSKRGAEPRDLPAAPRVTLTDDPMLLAAKRRIVRMGYLALAEIWREAGGADEGIFIQDQSLPLRLGSVARRAAYIEHTAYWLSTRDDTSLSRNTAQQHHDRFILMSRMLDLDLPGATRQAIERQRVSAWWKMNRYGTNGRADALVAYLGNRMFRRGLSLHQRARAEADFAALEGVRRIPDQMEEPDRVASRAHS